MNKEIYGYDMWNMEMKGYKRNMEMTWSKKNPKKLTFPYGWK